MANETILTIVGNTTAPAELRFTASGAAVANFTVASTPRTFDKASNEWKDGETLFMRCSAWRELAENIAETLAEKGVRVIVTGRLKSRSYETKEGERRTVTELDVDEVGPSLKYASAKVTRSQKGGGGQQSGGFGQGARSQGSGGAQGGPGGFGGNPGGGGGFGASQGRAQGVQTSDPWSQSQGSLGGDGWGAGQDDEPPF